MKGNWYVYDPDPPSPADFPDGRSALIGPFPSKQDADEYANVTHPDDESGNTVVLQAEAP